MGQPFVMVGRAPCRLVKAEFKNGILMVIMPKRVDKNSTHISISG